MTIYYLAENLIFFCFEFGSARYDSGTSRWWRWDTWRKHFFPEEFWGIFTRRWPTKESQRYVPFDMSYFVAYMTYHLIRCFEHIRIVLYRGIVRYRLLILT